jgi:hypothetical protein
MSKAYSTHERDEICSRLISQKELSSMKLGLPLNVDKGTGTKTNWNLSDYPSHSIVEIRSISGRTGSLSRSGSLSTETFCPTRRDKCGRKQKVT